MESKIIGFENGAERHTRLGERRLGEGNLVGAAIAFRDALASDAFDYEANAGLADVYYDADLVEQGLNCWYRALSSARTDEERARAYNGLGAGFYFLGKDMVAMHFFSEQLNLDQLGEYEYNDVIEDLQDQIEAEGDALDSADEPLFKIVGDEEKDAENAQKLQKAKGYIATGNMNEALTLLTEIGEDSGCFREALESIAFVLIVQGKWDTAQDVAEHILYLGEDSFTAHYVICCCKHKQGKTDEAEAIYATLERFSGENDFNVKMVMLSLDIGREGDAVNYIDRVLEQTPYNINMIYARALAKYNMGEIDECVKGFKDVLAFEENELVSKRLLEARLPDGVRPERFSYDFGVKEAETAFLMTDIIEKLAKKGKDFYVIDQIIRNSKCIVECGFFDLLPEMIRLGIGTDAEKYFEFLKGVLLDVTVRDEAKSIIIREYLLLGINVRVKCVSAYVYKEFVLVPHRFEGNNADLFNSVYATVCADLNLIDSTRIPVFAVRLLRAKHRVENKVVDVDESAACAAALKMMKFKILSDDEFVTALFDVTQEELDEAYAKLEINEEDDL